MKSHQPDQPATAITESKQSEDSVREMEGRLHVIFETMSEGIITSNLDGHLLYWNRAALEMHDFTSMDELQCHLSKFIDIFELSKLDGRIVKFEDWPMPRLLRGERLSNYDLSVRRLDKDWQRILSYSGNLVPDAKGRQLAFLTVTDITERTAAERQLREHDERFRLLIDGVKDYAIFMLDLAGNVVSWNTGAEHILGYKADEVMGQSYSRFLLAEDVASSKHQKELDQAAAEGQFDATGWRVRKDGSRFWANGILTALYNESGEVRGFAKITRDLTEQHQLETQLHQSQKMEAFGQLAGGVAHDFNNLLTVINGYSGLLVPQFPNGDPKRNMLEQIQRAGERAASLTRQLLAFSRQQVLEPKVLNLNALVHDTEKMLRRLIGEDVQIAVKLSPTLDPVKVDPGQIEQVIMNLAVNARDAMPHGGKLTIETQNVELDETYTKTHSEVQPGRFVLLAMTDMGCGMTPEVKARIFEPFYTTKGVGKGTGLGLAVVQGIVKQSRGSIEVYSEVGSGTSFKIYLPAVQEHPTSLPDPDLSKPALGTETILLVEDEDAVRELTALALQGCGYTVLKATCGKNALRLMESRSEMIDLLVTDVVMPEMSGSKLAEALQSRYPGLKVLYMSGYMDDAVFRHGILLDKVAFLQKPFTATSLARKVRAVLDETNKQKEPAKSQYEGPG